MIQKVYAVYDKKMEGFNRPMFLQNNGVAIRSFQDACEQQDSPIRNHPDDFALYLIGEYNDTLGELKPSKHVNISEARDYVKEK